MNNNKYKHCHWCGVRIARITKEKPGLFGFIEVEMKCYKNWGRPFKAFHTCKKCYAKLSKQK